MPKHITTEHATAVLKSFLPLYATAIGQPSSPTAYLEDVRRWNLEQAEGLLMENVTQRRYAAYRAHHTFAAAAAALLAEPDLLGVTAVTTETK